MKVASKTQMYEGAPWCLGRTDRFEINKPRLITLLERDYVIWKDEEGNLNALDNICPHAGANLAKGGYILDFQGKSCLACPYHGNKVQFLGDGKVIIEGKISSQAIQQLLPLQVIDGLVWTYGLHWKEHEGKLVSEPIQPKLPIPDYSNIPFLSKSHSQLHLSEIRHIYSHSESVNCNILQVIWNIHDGEHFAGTHRNTMLTKEIKIDNLSQNENSLSWQLIQYKRDDKDAKRNKINSLVDEVMVQSFNTFLPGLAVITLDYKGQLTVGVITIYPESPKNTKVCLDSYLDPEFTWWQKLLKFPQIANKFRAQLIFEDISILNNLYMTFNKKITLKNDTPAELAMNYLEHWDD
ncbi:Rieske 2Fe-2S domain-containing protein [Chlorogloeopsis sp. ULAP02]|uniref:Rieske 2Fe-2S domain-containing protein n=1 Tax=Chlorogloeopsis sp. ULAP02 TaxID=3107926 RepID=UPI003136C94F